MLQPVIHSTRALDAYAAGAWLPQLPQNFRDDAGRLMASVQKTVETLDEKLAELAQRSTTDALTGARNRRWLDEVSEPMMAEALSDGKGCGALVIDIDRFKQLNDTYGHALGDHILVVVGNGLREAVGADGEVVRLGGDEFAILLPGAAGADGVSAAAERVRQHVRQAVRRMPRDAQVTISVGGAWRRGGGTFNDLYHRADAQLYEAKRVGRDTALCA
ncbi:GGDEF domain-containing protein [Jiella sp. M17.18]|uniref:GGDEF domain-containing protein n=1 Tax=Jiella sp. M17.18 TaxID=3234247 RepID=UPI0034E0539F